MLKHGISYFLFSVGILALLFSLARTLYLVHRQARERKAALERAREAARKMNDLTGGNKG